MNNTDMILAVILFMVISWLVMLSIMSYILTAKFNGNNRVEKENNNEINLDRVKILLEDRAVDRIDEVLDTYIRNAASIYQVLEIAKTQKEFLNSDDIERMISYISTMVLKNMTAETVSLLSITHIINSQKDIIDLVNLRTKLYVLNFSIEFNVIKE
jgi:hypothetical protein